MAMTHDDVRELARLAEEGYGTATTDEYALKAAELEQEATMAEHEPRVEIYEDGEGQWRWRLKAGNGEIVATGESHTYRSDALRSAVTAAELLARAFIPA